MPTYHASFTSCGNPDYGQSGPISPPETATADKVDAIADAARDYIERHNLGSGNWPKCLVADETGKNVARISYNGRVWPLD